MENDDRLKVNLYGFVGRESPGSQEGPLQETVLPGIVDG